MKKDETYYFGEWRGKSMKKMKRRELYALLAEAYQLAGSFLIGAEILERDDRGSGELIERDGEPCIVVRAEVRFPRTALELEWCTGRFDLVEEIEYEPLFRRIG